MLVPSIRSIPTKKILVNSDSHLFRPESVSRTRIKGKREEPSGIKSEGVWNKTVYVKCYCMRTFNERMNTKC